MTPRRHADARLVLAVGALVPVFLAGCGGGGGTSDPPSAGGGSASGSSSASASATTSATRPEGRWTFVAWTVKRSDVKVSQFLARSILTSVEPGCEDGPCDLTVSPAGVGGTYREPETPPGPGDTPLTDSFDLAWDGSSYTGSIKARVVPCTVAGGSVVPKGYSTTASWSVTFAAATASAPARLHGTVTHTVKGTKASRAKGCTDYTETEAIAGVPTGSLDAKAAPQGTYEGTLSATSSTPKSLARPGTALWLGTMSASGDAAKPVLTGLTKASGALTRGQRGWSAALPPGAMDCNGSAGVSTKGADGTEEFTDLHPTALTDEGAPIFVGGYRLRANPNATGLAAKCSLNVYEGRILLVPEGAGR